MKIEEMIPGKWYKVLPYLFIEFSHIDEEGRIWYKDMYNKSHNSFYRNLNRPIRISLNDDIREFMKDNTITLDELKQLKSKGANIKPREMSSIADGEVIECNSKEESDEFRKMLHEAGYLWGSGQSYAFLDMWRVGITNQIRYHPKEGTFTDSRNINGDWFENNKCKYTGELFTITTFEEFIYGMGDKESIKNTNPTFTIKIIEDE